MYPVKLSTAAVPLPIGASEYRWLRSIHGAGDDSHSSYVAGLCIRSRMRATARENFARSLYFLDGRLADAVIEANKKSRTIEDFLAGEGPQVDVLVQNVSIEDMRTPPYKATVDFERVYYNYVDGAELKREKYTAHIVFVVKDRVPNAMIPVNPLGLTITYFREDQAFQ